jgi:hypothetical protein
MRWPYSSRAARHRERALVPARHRAVLLTPIPRRGGALHPSSSHRLMRKLRRFLEPLRRDVVSELVGNPGTLIIDSTLLSVLHTVGRLSSPPQVSRELPAG